MRFDNAGFFPLSGFFQAPHKSEIKDVDIAIVGSPLDLGAIGLAVLVMVLKRLGKRGDYKVIELSELLIIFSSINIFIINI